MPTPDPKRFSITHGSQSAVVDHERQAFIPMMFKSQGSAQEVCDLLNRLHESGEMIAVEIDQHPGATQQQRLRAASEALAKSVESWLKISREPDIVEHP